MRSSAPRTSARPPTSPFTSSSACRGAITSRRSRRSCAATAAAPTGESATSRRRRRSATSTRAGKTSSGPAPSSTRPERSATPTPTACSARPRPLQERESLAAVGEDLVDDPVTGHQVERREPLAKLRGLGVAHVDAVADPKRPRGGPDERGLHLASPLLAVEPKAIGEVRLGEAVGAGGAGRDVAAAERRRDAGARPPGDREDEERRGREVEGAVVVEEVRGVEPGAGAQLRDEPRWRCAGEAAGAAAVHEPRLGHLTDG